MASALPWKRLLAGAALVSLAFSLILLGVRAGAYALLPETVRSADGYKIAVFVLSLLFSYPFQAAAGAWYATRARLLRVYTGQTGAFLTGVLCALGMLLVNLALGGSLDAAFAWSTLAFTAAAGQFVSLPFTYLFARRRTAEIEAQPSTQAVMG